SNKPSIAYYTKETETHTYTLIELNPDNMPIAIYPIMSEFTNHVFPIPYGSCFYLFSDGFADQFGGEKNKKYGYKRLRELILTISHSNIENQGKLLEQEFENWKRDNHQLDDVTMIGIVVKNQLQ
ncbi:MAG: serine/threonine-protein phosphatase, partial [Bacteroidales bacterium]|nr:serine/threonine-protein phosphatase [Bacteroidales bacterium]